MPNSATMTSIFFFNGVYSLWGTADGKTNRKYLSWSLLNFRLRIFWNTKDDKNQNIISSLYVFEIFSNVNNRNRVF